MGSAGYQLLDKLHESQRTLVYRARREADGAAVVIKMPRKAYPPLSDVARLRWEHQIVRRLGATRVIVHHGLDRIEGRTALIMEDYGAESLASLLGAGRLDLGELLAIAIQVAAAIGEVHQGEVVHKDINPSNILVHPWTSQVKLIDFGLATPLSREGPASRPSVLLEGTLGYMSPEQTGRMGRAVDHRTDLYSFGATLYEMLTGTVLFSGADPAEMVHQHIAWAPVPPHVRVPSLPEVLSDITLKLLAKAPEDRYQSAYGALADLEECQRRLSPAGQIPRFVIADRDVSDRFQIPQRLYGRDLELAALMSAFDRASRGKVELVLVAGYAGVGKSAVVNEIQQGVIRERGRFVSGKFEQLGERTPYAPLIDAFRDLIRQLLSESEERLSSFRRRLASALGQNGQLIADVIPEVALVIGEQPPVQPLPPAESQHRFHLAFQSFVRTFAAEGHPLAIFLDDLHWADAASLELIQLVATDPSTRHLLLVGSYRDNEVKDGHPLALAVEAIRQAGTALSTLVLRPLGPAEVSALVHDTLLCGPERAAPLAALVLEKTAGNPFFARQFLTSLYTERLLEFDAEEARWRWDLDEIRRRGLTDNVIDLMASKIRRMSRPARRVLQIGACIGSQFDARTLAIVDDLDPAEREAGLRETLREGLLIPAGDAYELDAGRGGLGHGEGGEGAARALEFLHDRVQQTAYALIPEAERPGIHLQLGRLLRAHTPEDRIEEAVFPIVAQLDRGLALITDPEERYEAARLNLLAGRRAKAAAAFEPALRYLTAGLKVLPQDGFRARRDLAMDLHLEAMEAAYLNTRFDEAEALSAIALREARGWPDQVKVFETRMLYHTARSEFPEAIASAFQALSLLGVILPEPADPRSLPATHAEIQRLVAGRPVAELADLPPMRAPERLAAMRIMVLCGAPLYIAGAELTPVLMCEMVRLSVEHGNSSLSPVSYACYGMLHALLLRDMRGAAEYGALAMRLLERSGAQDIKAKVYFVVGVLITPWIRHAREMFPMVVDCVQAGMDAGDMEYAAYAACHVCTTRLFLGEPLEALAREHSRYLELVTRFKQRFPYHYLRAERQAVLNLLGHAEDPASLVGESFDEREGVPALIAMKNTNSLIIYYVCKSMLAYLFWRHAEAAEAADQAEAHVMGALGQMVVAEQVFYQALAHLAVCRAAGEEERARRLAIVDRGVASLSFWAEHAPANYLHKLRLVEAERARISGDVLGAMEAYEQAIRGAGESGYTHEEALANELAAEFYLSLDRGMLAEIHLLEARYGYLRWGAVAKAGALEQRYPALLLRQGSSRRSLPPPRPTGAPPAEIAAVPPLDLIAVMKAARAISGEIVLDRLLASLMRIVLEVAGAERGALLVEQDGELRVEVEGVVGDGEVSARPSSPAPSGEGGARLPALIINHVTRLRESVVLRDAASEGTFTADPYVAARRPRSVLCAPLINQGRVIAIVYLENNLAQGAFTADRLELLDLLLAQAALSIHNARLYADLARTTDRLRLSNEQLEEHSRTLEQRVEERTRELREKNEELLRALERLRDAQAQLVTQEKLASLGALAAGIAHEIKNPLNFVNNFAQLSLRLTEELTAALRSPDVRVPPEAARRVEGSLGYLQQNVGKIVEHGRRANGIVSSMLLHARTTAGPRAPADLNALVAETVNLAYHGVRAKDPGFNVAISAEYDPAMRPAEMVASDIRRVLVNLLDNAFDSMRRKRRERGAAFSPVLTLRTRDLGDAVEARIRDNGIGIPADVLGSIFDPFFTTKPPGEGTGLGLSISYDIIVQGHQGDLRADTAEGEFAELVIQLPKQPPPRPGNARPGAPPQAGAG